MKPLLSIDSVWCLKIESIVTIRLMLPFCAEKVGLSCVSPLLCSTHPPCCRLCSIRGSKCLCVLRVITNLEESDSCTLGLPEISHPDRGFESAFLRSLHRVNKGWKIKSLWVWRWGFNTHNTTLGKALSSGVEWSSPRGNNTGALKEETVIILQA